MSDRSMVYAETMNGYFLTTWSERLDNQRLFGARLRANQADQNNLLRRT